MGFGEWRIFAGIANGLAQLGADTRLLPGQQSDISCFAYNTGDINVGNGASVAMTMDSELWDTAGIHSTSANTSRFTVPAGQAGKWRYDAHLRMATGAVDGATGGSVQLNGTTLLASFYFGSNSGQASMGMVLCGEYLFSAGDYIELIASNLSTGGARNALGWTSSPNNGISMSFRRVA